MTHGYSLWIKAAPSVSSGCSKAKARDYNDIAQGRDAIFLGFTIKGKKIRWSDKALADFKHRIKELTGRSWGVSMEYRPIPELDEWIRRRMRMCYWKQWRWARYPR